MLAFNAPPVKATDPARNSARRIYRIRSEGGSVEQSSRIEELPDSQPGGYDRAKARSRMGVRRVMQNYCCQHCGISSENTFELFLHIFTDHLHKDVAIEAPQVWEIMQKMYPYLVAGYAYSPN